MPTKRDLGIGYLLGTGLGLIVSLVGYLLLIQEGFVETLLGAATAAVLAATLVVIGVWLHGSELSESVVWRVAQYSSLGLSIPVAAGVLITVVGISPPLAYLFPSLFINTIAAGAVIGLLLGTVSELRKEHRTALALNRRNRVLNRVLRHNLRNDMSVIMGYLDLLEEGTGADAEEAGRVIRDRIDEIVDLSEAARRIEDVEDPEATGPVDVAALVEGRAEIYADRYEGLTVEVDAPDRAMAGVGPLFSAVVDNLLQNAVDHGGVAPSVTITVRTLEDDAVEVSVRDDGPGIPAAEIDALEGTDPDAVHHGSGLGLWLVQWVTESYGGSVSFRESEAGTTVALELPAPSTVDRIVSAA